MATMLLKCIKYVHFVYIRLFPGFHDCVTTLYVCFSTIHYFDWLTSISSNCEICIHIKIYCIINDDTFPE